MSDDQKPEANQAARPAPKREPVFLLPFPVLSLCVLMLLVQLASDLVLNESGRAELVAWFAFVPYRALDPANIEGGWLPLLWTPITHAFLHAGWEHVGLNAVWLAAFGTPVSQRYGGVRMIVLFLVGAVLGALAFAVSTLPSLQVLVGASGGIAALTGAATRFIFQPPVIEVDEKTGERRFLGRRLATLGEFVRDGRARFFALIWIVLNGIVPILPAVAGAGVQIAWQTHIAGFLAGFLLVPLFERRRA